MTPTKSFPEIDNFVRLFVPQGVKATMHKWDKHIVDMFTQGYCYNFAKIVQIAFRHKYKCTIVGRGVFNEASNFKELVTDIADMNFTHFMCHVEHPDKPNRQCVYDIYGAWPVDDNKDYQPLILRERRQKERFMEDIAGLPLEEFVRRYPLEDHEGWKLTWFLSNRESEHVRKEMLKYKF